MSLWSRFLDAVDAPRFCRDCGEPIIVRNLGKFDPETGAEQDDWAWSCPKVHLSSGGGRFRAEQSGYHIHPYGQGRPRWHRAAQSAAPSSSEDGIA